MHGKKQRKEIRFAYGTSCGTHTPGASESESKIEVSSGGKLRAQQALLLEPLGELPKKCPKVGAITPSSLNIHERELVPQHRRGHRYDVRQQPMLRVHEAFNLGGGQITPLLRRRLQRRQDIGAVRQCFLQVRAHRHPPHDALLQFLRRPTWRVNKCPRRRQGMKRLERVLLQQRQSVLRGLSPCSLPLRRRVPRLLRTRHRLCNFPGTNAKTPPLRQLQPIIVEIDLEPRVLDYLVQRRPLLRLHHKHPTDDILHRVCEVPRHPVFPTLDFVEQRVHVRVLEREVSSKHHKQDHPARPNIRRDSVVSLLLQHLWRHVIRCTANGLQQRPTLSRAPALQVRETKVRDLKRVCPVEQQVFRLQVPVRDALVVAVVHTEDHHLKVPPRGRFVKPLCCNNFI
eukprot:Hpha_TRINITY_DN15298_c0_g3::TRINITY_DN15298_c0_g3_i1::g.68253::m.68253